MHNNKVFEAVIPNSLYFANFLQKLKLYCAAPNFTRFLVFDR